jgi:eukaryotic-like serine/threonine-protein kinase
MALAVGTRLGPYQILVPIGAGGMGEVYRAHDPRMGRDVAIKISAERFSDRFSREVRAVAALNHSNVCHLYDVGPNYLVMELVEGPTLAERIQQGPVPLEDALAIAKQITDGVEAAHEKGIVHRDLKPGNIKLRPDGAVKVLDFGLAKMAEAEDAGPLPEDSPTLTLDAATRAGTILGTAAYMSPEQALGKPADKRADIWSFGAVLYEMLSGRRAFGGESTSDILAAVLKLEPDWSALPKKTPAPILSLIRRCLMKDRRQRLQAIGDARIVIEECLSGALPEMAEPPPARRRVLPWMIATVCFLAAVVSTVLWQSRPQPQMRATRFTVTAPPETDFTNPYGATAVSPDGRLLVFGAAGGKGAPVLWVRPFDSLTAQPLPGTEGGNFPFWSPDSKSLAFFSERKLKRIEIVGGAPLTLCDATYTTGPMGGAWNRNGTILFSGADGLYQVSSSGGVPARVTQEDAARQESGHGFPQFHPDGKRFLYFIQSPDENVQGVYAGSLDRPRDRALIVRTAAKAYYQLLQFDGTGWLLWLREQTLLAQPFDEGKAV